MDRFKVVPALQGWKVVDSKVNKSCKYTGAASVPPKYAEEIWNNYYSALGFSARLEHANEN